MNNTTTPHSPTGPDTDGHEATAPEDKRRDAASTLGIAPGVVAEATAALPEDQRDALLWLYHHGTKQGMTLGALAAAVWRDKNTLYQVFTGRHTAGKAAIVADILRYKETAELTGARFIETRLTKRLFAMFNMAWRYNSVVLIIGETQVGKTTAAREYTLRQATKGQRTVYVSMPTGGRIGDFVHALAKALNLSTHTTLRELKSQVAERLNARTLLIVDEAHQCLLRAKRKPESAGYLEPLEFLRNEIYRDGTGASLALMGTKVLSEEIEHGFGSGWLKQTAQRRISLLNIKDLPEAAELNAFAAAHGLPVAEGEAAKLQEYIITSAGLGAWLKLLRMGAGNAVKAAGSGAPAKGTGEPVMTWDNVLRAYTARRNLEA